MLQVSQLTAGYGRLPVLHDVSLAVEAGTITALIGSNGAGKSTTLRAIVGAVSVLRGEIAFEGKPITGMPTSGIVRRGISLVPEGRRIFPGLTVLENLKVGAYVRQHRGERKQRIDEVFQLFPRLYERRRQLGSSLSGGEQQMLAIGRGLMSRPKLLMLDEPSMGLAPIVIDQVFEAIAAVRKRGTTLLLVEQNAKRALELADRAFVLESGRVVMSGSGADLMHNEQVVDAYFGT
jgi:branched-chain amino acid transport system ATP-binding protein